MYSKEVGGNIAKACTHNARVSVKNTKPVCRAVRGMYLDKAKKFLEEIIKKRKNIGGKYYTKSTTEVLNLLKSAEKNAEFKNLDLKNVYIVHVAALDGTRMFRRRHKRSLGTKLKTANLEIILKEKGGRIEPREKKKGEKEKGKETKEVREEKKKSAEAAEKQKVKKEVRPEGKVKKDETKETEGKKISAKKEGQEEKTKSKEKPAQKTVEPKKAEKGKDGQKRESKKQSQEKSKVEKES